VEPLEVWTCQRAENLKKKRRDRVGGLVISEEEETYMHIHTYKKIHPHMHSSAAHFKKMSNYSECCI